MRAGSESADESAGAMKRGTTEKEQQLHEYLVSKSVRNTAELEALQKVGIVWMNKYNN